MPEINTGAPQTFLVNCILTNCILTRSSEGYKPLGVMRSLRSHDPVVDHWNYFAPLKPRVQTRFVLHHRCQIVEAFLDVFENSYRIH